MTDQKENGTDSQTLRVTRSEGATAGENDQFELRPGGLCSMFKGIEEHVKRFTDCERLLDVVSSVSRTALPYLTRSGLQ